MAGMSRRKGASFERQVATVLSDELGFKFSRDLRQYQASDHGDLVADVPGFPFLIECKAYATGTECKPAWIEQAQKAAKITGQHPCVVWKINRHPIRCRVPITAIAEAHGTIAVINEYADVSLQGFAYLAREIMARNAERRKFTQAAE